MEQKKLKVAVVVAHHSYEVCQFQELFESMPEIHPYIQHVEQFTSSSQEVRDSYDVIVFYTMWLPTPINDGPWYEGKALDAFSALGKAHQGIVVLHHSILAFQDWPYWAELTGYDPKKYRDYAFDIPMDFANAAPEHPIMKGIPNFTMVDEAYEGDGVEDVPGVEVLMTCGYEKNFSTVAWTKQHGNARVFCFQPGHGPSSYNHPQFREVLRRGILWTAEQI